MVSIDPATMNNRPGVFVPRKWFILTVLSTMTLLLLQLRATFLMPASTTARSTSTLSLPTVSSNSIHALRHHHSSSSSSSYNSNNDQCALFLAESAIPFGGLGIFTGIGLHKGDRIGYPDICIYVNDMKAPERQWMQMRTHTWGKGNFFGQHEGQTSRAACEGIVTTFNTMPGHMINTKIISPSMPTNAGLHRKSSPGAGAITHHYGIHAEALDVVRAGSELTIDYGDWDFDDNKEYTVS